MSLAKEGKYILQRALRSLFINTKLFLFIKHAHYLPLLDDSQGGKWDAKGVPGGQGSTMGVQGGQEGRDVWGVQGGREGKLA